MTKHNEQNTPSGFKNYLNDDSAEHVTFIENRILKSITWYDMKAAKYKKCYVLLTSSSIVINAGIPILSAYTNLTLLVAVLSACVECLCGRLHFDSGSQQVPRTVDQISI